LLQLLPAMVRVRVDRLVRAAANLARLSPVQQVARREEALRERSRRLDAAAMARLTRSRNALASRRAADRLERAMAERFAAATRGLAHRRERLLALSPDAVLSRGYSLTLDEETGAVVRSATDTKVDRKLRIRLATGRLGARVEEVEP
jgi:exodeoxyribonuclease VII large subunit